MHITLQYHRYKLCLTHITTCYTLRDDMSKNAGLKFTMLDTFKRIVHNSLNIYKYSSAQHYSLKRVEAMQVTHIKPLQSRCKYFSNTITWSPKHLLSYKAWHVKLYPKVQSSGLHTQSISIRILKKITVSTLIRKDNSYMIFSTTKDCYKSNILKH